MSRTITIKFSLIKESNKRSSNELISEISEAFSSEEFVIPWVDKVETISLSEIE